FYNAGIIESGTTNTTNFFITRETFFGTSNLLLGALSGSKTTVNASNIVNPGTIKVGFESVLSLKGSSIDLSRGAIQSEQDGFSLASGANIGFFFNQRIFDGYWGVGDVRTQPFVF